MEDKWFHRLMLPSCESVLFFVRFVVINRIHFIWKESEREEKFEVRKGGKIYKYKIDYKKCPFLCWSYDSVVMYGSSIWQPVTVNLLFIIERFLEKCQVKLFKFAFTVSNGIPLGCFSVLFSSKCKKVLWVTLKVILLGGLGFFL